jgi:hypothetical protein
MGIIITGGEWDFIFETNKHIAARAVKEML